MTAAQTKLFALVDKYAHECPQVRIIAYPVNRGKGFAIKTGILAAQGDLILINDADGSSPIEEFTTTE